MVVRRYWTFLPKSIFVDTPAGFIGGSFILAASARKAHRRKTQAIIFWRNTRVADSLSQIAFWRWHFWCWRFFAYPADPVRLSHACAAARARACREHRGWSLYSA